MPGIEPTNPMASPALGLIDYPVAILYRHQCGGKQSNKRFFASPLRNDFRLRDCECPSRPYHATTSQNPVADRRSQEVDLELGGERANLRRHQAERRIAGGRIRNGGDGSGVDETVLL